MNVRSYRHTEQIEESGIRKGLEIRVIGICEADANAFWAIVSYVATPSSYPWQQ